MEPRTDRNRSHSTCVCNCYNLQALALCVHTEVVQHFRILFTLARRVLLVQAFRQLRSPLTLNPDRRARGVTQA